MIRRRDIEDARRQLSGAGILRPTPVERSDTLTRLIGRPIILKPEHRQRTGSYKIRGAYNFVSRLDPGVGVVAASAGNHAQGVALAATRTGRPSTVFMPEGAAIPKVEATANYGATVRLEGKTVDDCIDLARAHAEATGAVYVPPFDHPLVIAGQGTVGLELETEAGDAEVVVVPVGGGGLIAGVATALHTTGGRRRPPRIVGVEASGAACMTAALAAGHPVELDQVTTMADGSALRSTSALALAHVQAHVDVVVTVDEEEISRAVLLLLERVKMVVEPAGALALAAVLAGRVAGSGPAVAVLTGGNVDPLLLIKLIGHGLSAAGRYLVLRAVIEDRPGALAGFTATLAAMGLNVLNVEHHRSGMALAIDEVEVQITVETRGAEHRDEVMDDLRSTGYRVQLLPGTPG